MAVYPMPEETMARLIHEEITRRTKEIVDQEAKAALERVYERMSGEIDKVALKVLANYDIRMMGHQLVISVSKPSAS